MAAVVMDGWSDPTGSGGGSDTGAVGYYSDDDTPITKPPTIGPPKPRNIGYGPGGISGF